MPNGTIHTLRLKYNIFTKSNVDNVSICVLQEMICRTFIKDFSAFFNELAGHKSSKKLRDYINKPRCFKSVSRRLRRTFLDEQEIDE